MDPAQLRSIGLLDQLSDEELETLSDKFVLQEVPAGRKIVTEGAPIHSLYLLCSGTVHVRRLVQDREVMVARIGPGGFFGEMNLFDPGMATASIYSMDKVTLAIADHVVLRECMSAHTAMGYNIVSSIMTVMCRRLRETNNRLVTAYFWAGGSPVEPGAAE